VELEGDHGTASWNGHRRVEYTGRAWGALIPRQERKAIAYARARIKDYWIVNLVDRVLELHREPAGPGPARRRRGYAVIETLGPRATATPLAAPGAVIRVADLLP
jgi:Putative restriction endonuclease